MPSVQRLTWYFFFFNDPATTEIYTLSLHDALPISPAGAGHEREVELDPDLAPVLAQRAHDHHREVALLGCRQQDRFHNGHVLGVRDIERRLREELLLAVAEQLAEPRVHAQEAAVERRQRHADRSVLECDRQTLLDRRALRGGTSLIGYVLSRAHEVRHAAVGVGECGRRPADQT